MSDEKVEVAIVALNFYTPFLYVKHICERRFSAVSVRIVNNYTNLLEQVADSKMLVVYYHATFVDENREELAKQTDELVTTSIERGIPVGTIYAAMGKSVYPRVKGSLFDQSTSLLDFNSFLPDEVGKWLETYEG